MLPNIRRLFLVLFVCVYLLFAQFSFQANAQNELSLPDQVLQATLLKLAPSDTQIVVDSALLLEPDESKDDFKSFASLYPTDEEAGVWSARYKVSTTHPTGAVHRDLPAFQGCHNDVEIIIINALIAPPGAIREPVFGDLSIADAAESGFATPEIANELRESGINVDQHIIGSQLSLTGLDFTKHSRHMFTRDSRSVFTRHSRPMFTTQRRPVFTTLVVKAVAESLLRKTKESQEHGADPREHHTRNHLSLKSWGKRTANIKRYRIIQTNNS
ncbi:MAG: hypothetical protein CL609_24400 [Anaerolineaceae bacterium]|nr:hypothetical protein [Anaerolineaceae bacterium]